MTHAAATLLVIRYPMIWSGTPHDKQRQKNAGCGRASAAGVLAHQN